MNRKERDKFRNSKEWKEFRQSKYEEQKGLDAITFKKLYKGFNCHHLDFNKEHYDKLIPSNFICLNKRTHEILHGLFDQLRYTNLKELINRYEHYLNIMLKLQRS